MKIIDRIDEILQDRNHNYIDEIVKTLQGK